MRSSSQPALATGLTGVTVVASSLLLAGCAAAPAAPAGASSDASNFTPCAVSDITGFDDKDFNQLTYEGVQAAADQLGTETFTADSASEDQYAGNIQGLVEQDCDLIVTVGFALANATRDAAERSPDVDFALIDSIVTDSEGAPIEVGNVKPVLFDTAQAAALAGYLAAGVSKTGAVGTYGGMPFPSVTVFMDGFTDGVAHYNEVHSADVKVLGWDKAAQNGLFVGGFDDQIKARTLTSGLLDQGVDVIMPVAGRLFEASAAVADEQGADLAIIGVNGDVYDAVPTYRSYCLTSVLKNLTTAAEEVTLAAAEGDFSSTPYVGTLENDGVGIAPTHDWESRIDPALLDEVEDLRLQIISGDFVVESPSSPKA
ncbi:BMP family ABC transporter substrate-binding protein [Agromyces sp. ISL-38]|nr:BMP family ABC transporter substrate-binding protein [Agromyces sp. ISL-38]